jgi:hypothetical protein
MPARLSPGQSGTRRPRGRMVIAAVAVLAVLLGPTCLWLFLPSSRLKAANFSRLKPGMTRVDVERLLGGPPGDYGPHADGSVDYGDGSVLQVFAAPSAGVARPDTWTDDRNHFYVFFDNDGQVVAGSKQSRFWRSPKGWSWLAKIKATMRAMLF